MKKHLNATFKIALGATAFITSMPAVYAQGIEEVFVTARKRDEGVQTVPLSIAALSSDMLEQRNVRQIEDLNAVVPGFRFGAEGGRANNNIMMRGLSKIPLGEGVPAVVTYFANIALPGTGANIPTFDIANIQVLKGPQGTLFGRNTMGGAVVITPELPSLSGDISGYIRGAYGSKDYRSFEGAVNVPIVEDKVALRLAGQVRRGDGLNKNLSGGKDFDDIHQNSYRVSLLLQPVEWIENTTVWDHFQADETAAMLHLFRVNPSLGAIAAGFNSPVTAAGTPNPLAPFQVGTQINNQVLDYYSRARAADFHEGFSDVDGGFAKRHSYGISNDTSIDMGFATLRNIFGWRQHDSSEFINTPGTGPMSIALGPLGNPDFVFYHASAERSRKFLSDELQLFGTAYDDKIDWIVGAFYNNDKSAGGDNGSQSDRFRIVGLQALPSFTSAHVENTNKALFGQIGVDLSDWTIEGLKLNAGYRKSWDDVEACGGGSTAGYMSPGTCESIAAQNLPDGTGVRKTDGSEASWTWGLDWQISPDTMVYFANRRGYRGVNINTPAFETPYTTGGSPADLLALGLAPCQLGATQVNCPDLTGVQTTEPEIVTDWEIGLKNDWSIGDVKGRINIAAFTMDYKDAVQFINVVNTGGMPSSAPDLPTNSSVGVNAADIKVEGVEADLTVIPVPSLTLTLSAAFTDQDVEKISGTLTESEITLPTPTFSGSFAFSWVLPVTPLDGELIFNGDYYKTRDYSGQGGENLPGYDVTNFRLNWRDIAKSGLDVAVYVKNAFDEEYFASPSVMLAAFPVSTVLVGDPRTWGVEATYKF